MTTERPPATIRKFREKRGLRLLFYFNEIDFFDSYPFAYDHPPPIHDRFVSYSFRIPPSLRQSPEEMGTPFMIFPKEIIRRHMANLLTSILGWQIVQS